MFQKRMRRAWLAVQLSGSSNRQDRAAGVGIHVTHKSLIWNAMRAHKTCWHKGYFSRPAQDVINKPLDYWYA